jgi:hypothetical protein
MFKTHRWSSAAQPPVAYYKESNKTRGSVITLPTLIIIIIIINKHNAELQRADPGTKVTG